MKPNPPFLKSFLWAIALGWVALVLMPASASAAASGQKAAVEEEEEGVVEGIALARSGGRWLGLTMDGLNLRLTFYDDKKKPTEVDVVRATARWNRPTLARAERSVLNPAGDGVSLVGNNPVRKPWVFVVYLALVGANDEVVESYQIQLSDEVVPPDPETK